MKIPLLRYDTGDVGKLIKFEHEGKIYDAIYLQGRNCTSFLVGSNILKYKNNIK